MTLEILMATTYLNQEGPLPQGISDLSDELVPCLLINQAVSPDHKVDRTDKLLRIKSFTEKGLSKSRNRAIEHAEGDIVLLADDDIRFESGIQKKILDQFQKFKDTDIICFQILKRKGVLYKKYEKSEKQINRWSSLKVSSVEIAFRLASIRKKGVIFDEHFGLGTDFPSGEEQVFLKDALDSGLNVRYVPIPIAMHEAASSGETGWNHLKYRQSKGALLYRLFGEFSLFLIPLFSLKKSHLTSVSWLQLTRDMFNGRRNYKSNR